MLLDRNGRTASPVDAARRHIAYIEIYSDYASSFKAIEFGAESMILLLLLVVVGIYHTCIY